MQDPKPVSVSLKVSGGRVLLRLQVNNPADPRREKGQKEAAPQEEAQQQLGPETAAPVKAAEQPEDAPRAGPDTPQGSPAAAARRSGLHVTISPQLPTPERKRPKEVIDVLREVMRQKRKQERLRRLREEHRGLAVPLAEEAGADAAANRDSGARGVDQSPARPAAAAAGASSSRASGAAGASSSGADGGGGGSAGPNSRSRAKWRDLVRQLDELKASNKAAEGEVGRVLDQMFSMNAELMGCWHEEMSEQMAAMTSKMEVLAEENSRLREEVVSLKDGASTPTNGSELSHFKDRLRRHPSGAPRPGPAASACSDASSLRSSAIAPPSGSLWRGWGGRRAYSTADAYSLPPTPGSHAGGGAASAVTPAARGRAGGSMPPPVDLEALFDSFGTGSARARASGAAGSARGGASDAVALSPRSVLTDA
ncbi:hypothetical protein Rsub_03042 [Raphidocelis subcapitata]|uniref:Uncharacterized protein n=1 Tax=Raphidocelis subcapitata TaxID=307507 RepID=A0A2V0NSX9_9CHLO|nr:hypothetical protein Rsub_03042 [Raphidocelis subcapitata]|eukprot:GBF90741.1 hypothetical protein Rsub_03042 [Raphidocelis subcapitata]